MSDYGSTLSDLGIDLGSSMPQPNAGLLTYLRGLGLDLGTIRENKQRRLAEIAANKIKQDQMIAEAKTKSDETSTTNLASRGVSRSGEADKRYAENTKAMLDAYGESTANAATATDAANREAQAAEMGITRSATEYLLGLSEEQQRTRAQQQAQMEQANAQLGETQRFNNAYLDMMREQNEATRNSPVLNPYAEAETQINRETYASLGSAPPERNFNLGIYPTRPRTPTRRSSSRDVRAV